MTTTYKTDGGFLLNLDSDSWLSWLNEIVKPRRLAESCAWLYCDFPFHVHSTVFVFPIRNVGMKGRGTLESFAPNPIDFARVKALTKARKLTRVGNVHTHVFNFKPRTYAELHEASLPSKLDLAFARRFNSIIRGIVTVVFANPREVGMFGSILWHDQFGTVLYQEEMIEK